MSHGERRKKTPEEIAEERIESAWKSGACELELTGLGLIQLQRQGVISTWHDRKILGARNGRAWLTTTSSAPI